MAGNDRAKNKKSGESMLNEFVSPKPNKKLIKRLIPVNRYFMLKGMPLLRDIPGLRKIPGLRGLCNVRNFDFPQADRDRMSGVCGENKVTFIVPNHPEFFTDWMLDKYVCTNCAKNAASWATHGVVNGLGRFAQKFWLANNLIAQIPGNTEPSRRHSIDWALKGHGVLLHPEGGVGWHSNHIGKLYPGSFDMARKAMVEAKENGKEVEAYVAPVIWKLAFTKNVSLNLAKECVYVEGKLKISDGDKYEQIQSRVFNIYDVLLARDIQRWEVKTKLNAPYRVRQLALIKALSSQLADAIGDKSKDIELLLRAGRRWQRENKSHENKKHVGRLIKVISRHDCLGEYAFASDTITQEELAEHIKRIRRDYCKGSIRDVVNAFLPQPAGPRTAHLRVPEAFALHSKPDTKAGVNELRARMQECLDELNAQIKKDNGFIWYPNPFAG